jgi:TolB-like protein/DNA-binding winged helix-turn-helix (wHTH) protein/Tfp pilus assembly protein PilF
MSPSQISDNDILFYGGVMMGFQLGTWLVRPDLNRIVRGSRSYRLSPRAMEVLVCLAKRGGEVVSKDAIFQEAWPGTHVTDDALTKCIGELRRVFHSTAGEPPLIETVAKRGYRVAASVSWDTVDTIGDGKLHMAGADAESRPAMLAAVAGAPDRFSRVRSLKLGVLVLTLAIAVSFGLFKLRTSLNVARRPPGIQSIAVLPLTNLSGDPEQEYFADGMTEELITQLAQIDAWKVISRTSAMRYKGSKKSLPEIARDLGVTGIVEGTVLRIGGRLRITAQLINAETDTHLWSGSFESGLSDVLTLQRNIARDISRELRVKIAPDVRMSARRPAPVVPEAYENYLKGRYFLDRSQFLKAASYFERATATDPNFALAHALLAEAEGMQAFSLDIPVTARVVKAMEIALELDDTLAEAHMIAGDATFFGNWDWDKGEAEFRRAVDLDHTSVDAAAHYAGCLHALGRWDAASEACRRALELDPVSPRLNVMFLQLLVDNHKYGQAIEQFRKAIELDPNNRAAYASVGEAYELQGRETEATAAYIKADRLSGKSMEQVQSLESAANSGGVRGYWRRRLEMLQERAKSDPVPPYDFALVYVHIRENGRAMDMLESAYRQHAPRLAWIRARAVWQQLGPDARYQSLLRRMHFPQ